MIKSPNHLLPIPAVILAGGLGRRMGGGDKPLVRIGGRPMLDHVIDRLRPQAGALAINANGDPARFADYGLPVIEDTVGGFAGPLAGILAGMRWATTHHSEAGTIISVAADTPFFPDTLVAQLTRALAGGGRAITLAASADGVHPVFAAWPLQLADDLEAFLTGDHGGKILHFVDRYQRVEVLFDEAPLADGTRLDPFFNVNTLEDVAQANRFMSSFRRSIG